MGDRTAGRPVNRGRRETGASGRTEALRRRIEETRALTGHALQCASCDRLSSGRATAWKMRRVGDGQVAAFCPECDELEFG